LGGLTAVLAGVAITAVCDTTSKRGRFDEIDVQRINIVEPDGKIRLIISDRAKFPGSYYQGQEIKRTDRQAIGLLFMDDEAIALPPDQRQAALNQFLKEHPGDHPRVQFGRAAHKSAVLRMADADGRDRIVMKVNADGAPALQFLDESGKVADERPRTRPGGVSRAAAARSARIHPFRRARRPRKPKEPCEPVTE
jgi:hypothetical protein